MFGNYGKGIIGFALFLAGGSTGVAQDVDAQEATVETVSLVAILANPRAYHGHRIVTQGVIGIEFEGDALYLAREHRESHIYANAVWVNVGNEGWDMNELATLDNKYVAIEGRVDAMNSGHLSLFAAALVDVSGVRALE